MASELGPRVDLTMYGDWGTANFHTITGWIAAHMRWRSARPSTFTVRTGSAYREGIEAVGRGDADLAITTPIHMACAGRAKAGTSTPAAPIPTCARWATCRRTTG